MGTLVIIRHAAKKYGNKDGGKPRYDPSILDKEWERCPEVFKDYIITYNIEPTRIISSPYLRTRQTSQMLSETTGIDFEINNFFSEFLGHNKGFFKQDFDPITYSHNPIPPEHISDFKFRVKNIFDSIIKETKEGDVVWVVTHGYVIRTFLSLKGIKCNSIKFLKGVIVNEEEITKI